MSNSASRRADFGARPNPAQRYGSPGEIATYWGSTERTVRNLIASGQLPAYRLGTRSIRIAFDDADKLLSPIPTAKAG